MAITLASGINATQNRVTLTEALTASPGDLFRIDNEVVEFGGYGRLTGGRLVSHSGKVVSFSRGVNGTTAATHTATTAVLRVADGLVSAVGAPDPFVTASGASNLAAVLAEGNDTGENTIEMPLGTIDGTVAFGTVSIKASDDGNDLGAELNLNPATTDLPGDIYLYGGGGDAGNPGGGVILQGGSGNGGPGTPASIVASGGTGAGNPGKVALTTGGSTGAAGEFLGSDGAGNATWQPLFGSTPEVPATPTEQDIVDALVALGLITQAAP